MERNIDSELIEWKNDPLRKVLLLRGARQVGKTYSVRNLGKSFRYFLEINFEEEKRIKSFFEDSLNPQEICKNLSAYFSIPIVPGETLLFFDEIQNVPDAISSLRFFYEKMPRLHVIGAGSLLEFALSQIPSFGVGRISSLFMYPLSFHEFLLATENSHLWEIVLGADFTKPIDSVLHDKLIDYYKTFQLIGGLPEIVKTYIDGTDYLLCQKKLDDLIITFKDDFAKYKDRAPLHKLEEIFHSIPFQSGNKFKYSNVDSLSANVAIKDALDLIVKAGLAFKIFHSSANGIPLGAQVNHKKFKVILFDTGIHQRLLNANIGDYLLAKDFNLINKGSVAEVFAGLEIIKNSSCHLRPNIYYWHREARGSNAEIDYLIEKNSKIIPVEIKAGSKGSMQSLFLFLKEKKIDCGLRFSLENFNQYEKIKTAPIYAIKRSLF